MQTGTVRDEEGNEFAGQKRPNGSVTWKVGSMTRYADIGDFADLGFTWTPAPADDDAPLAYREPVDAPRFFRITGEGL
ncbi:hypothetical protein [Paraburkholderia rhynchosiae]|uniref:Uncharacterized protein n=1 Tax=Paraburkholderia rhynchosiae TaxID=487049 RepID=A0A2N7W982_9BURK|nr:hypothetical protein [Paraburkholderia rhynchosiae]PMS25966.1 hypothetical protein C0Z16_27925 [Paraburkholderia rhynchosiae]CAB3730599.1 hypothetical protein LMG27174_05760 [Paraburkholderia rhynchosiae]